MIKTTSLELSKQLKENGFPQNTEFYWNDKHKNRLSDGSWDEVPVRLLPKHHYYGTSPNDDYFAAPTAEEILERLPEVITYGDLGEPMEYGDMMLNIYKREDGWHISYESESRYWHREVESSLVEATGKLWIYLKEHELL